MRIFKRNRVLRPIVFRRGFTLVEMLVVITIIIVLSVLTFTLVDFSMNSDRLSGGSRQVQNFLEGARDRAIHANEPRGVRFLLDNTNRTVSSMVYIGPPKSFSEGQIIIDSVDKRTISFTGGADWSSLVDLANPANSFLIDGARIRIDKSNVFYTVVNNSGWKLTRDFADISKLGISLSYKLELAPAILPDQDPAQLPRDIVIDLNGSRVPSSWPSPRMDILFSPRGTVIGTAATNGLIHLLLSDRKEVESGLRIGAPDEDLNANGVLDAGEDANGNGVLDRGKAKGETLVTIITKTGAINTSQVDPTDLFNNITGAPGADGKADDPFRFAETGKEAK